jgi:hypothetical protein
MRTRRRGVMPVPGKVSDEHFNLLVDSTRISGVGVLSALYDHLVLGDRKSVAMQRYRVNISQFTRRLKAIEKASDLARRLAKFY